MTPWELAKSKSEHAEQRALFAWANCAAQYGFDVANDERGYSVESREILLTEMAVYNWRPKHCVPELAFMFAIPNGGSRGDTAKARQIRGGQLKAEGVKPGVPDIMLPVASSHKYGCRGLFIEMKKESRRNHIGAASDEQKAYHTFLSGQGYRVVICYNWQEAAKAVQAYLS